MNRPARVNRVPTQIEAELCRRVARIEAQRQRWNLKGRQPDAADARAGRVVRRFLDVIEERACGELRAGRAKHSRAAVQAWIAGPARQPSRVAPRLPPRPPQ